MNIILICVFMNPKVN